MSKHCFLRLGDDPLEDAEYHPTIRSAMAVYQSAAIQLNRYGQRLDATLHLVDGPDDTPVEYPDYVLELGPSGRVLRTPA